jgi:5-methylcytosine-specific restriction endonuclease McrA
VRGEPFTGPNFKSSMMSKPAEKLARARAEEKHWQAIRQIVLARDKRTCRACHGKDQIDVHHVRLRSAGGTDTTDNLACLCRVCHADVHLHKLHIAGNADKRLRITP